MAMAAGLAAAALGAPAEAQTRGQGRVSATILPPGAFSAESDLSFGVLKTNGRDGFVTLGSTGERQASGGLTFVGEEAGMVASLVVIDDGATQYAIDAPEEIQVGPMTASTQLQETIEDGRRTIVVSAQLQVPADTPPTDYRGGLLVTAVFN